MDADKWLTLPDDLLVNIFRRLESIAVFRCAVVCRPWRRTIIDNAWCLWPRPDRFLPDVLLGFLDKHSGFPRLWPFVPVVWVDGRRYNYLLSSRDRFLLLGQEKIGENLCLWSTQTGVCRVLPAAAFDTADSTECIYVLASGDGDETAVSILAVNWQPGGAKDGIIYQIFSSSSGAWGPVKRSAKFPEDVAYVINNVGDIIDSMVCRGTVSWFVALVPNCDVNGRPLPTMSSKKIFSVDLSTGRTWTTETPPSTSASILAVSEDGQLSLVTWLCYSCQLQVWVLVGDGQWTLRRTMDVQKLLLNCRTLPLSGFCPRSGYVFGKGLDDQGYTHHFVVGIDGTSPRLIGRLESSSDDSSESGSDDSSESGSDGSYFPYEMDWSKYISSYISKMKFF